MLRTETQIVNRLNELTGKEWMLFTKSWFVLNPAPRGRKLLHPACYPEELATGFIQFFTKKNDWVLDPFLGSGTTLVAAKRIARNGIGIELYRKYAQLAKSRLNLVNETQAESRVYVDDSRNIERIFRENKLSRPKLCFTSAPYWNQLSQKHRRQRGRTARGLPTTYGKASSDLANIEDYGEFLSEIGRIFDGVYNVMLDNSYLGIVCNNVYKHGRVWPLAYDLFTLLSRRWVPKDERIWCQDNKPLYPFGIYSEWVANRCHHYCFVFKKKTI